MVTLDKLRDDIVDAVIDVLRLRNLKNETIWRKRKIWIFIIYKW